MAFDKNKVDRALNQLGMGAIEDNSEYVLKIQSDFYDMFYANLGIENLDERDTIAHLCTAANYILFSSTDDEELHCKKANDILTMYTGMSQPYMYHS